jgi:beta-glucosidase
MIFVIFLLLLMTRSLALTCQDDSLKDLKFCDIDLSFEDRVEDLLPRLNLSEKISQFGMVGQAIERLGIREYNFGGEALHGLWSTCYNGTYCPTQFPSPITMASSWNRDAWEDAARASAIEARALYRENLLHYPDGFGDGCSKSLEGCLGLSYYAPNINIGRDPRWGRIEEIPGEDPRFNGEYGTRFVRGFQGNGTYLLASTVVKHFVAYSLEIDIENMNPTEFCGNANCTTPNDRHSFNAIVDEIDLKETYLPAFKDVVQAGAWGVMCSYNAVNGEPMCTNKALIGDTLRSEFGFEGVVATDCGALNDARIHHHRYNTVSSSISLFLHTHKQTYTHTHTGRGNSHGCDSSGD